MKSENDELFYYGEKGILPGDPTLAEIKERCVEIQKKNEKKFLSMNPKHCFEKGVAKLLSDVVQSPVRIDYLRFYDW